MTTIIVTILLNLGILFPNDQTSEFPPATAASPETEHVDDPIVEVDVDGG